MGIFGEGINMEKEVEENKINDNFLFNEALLQECLGKKVNVQKYHQGFNKYFMEFFTSEEVILFGAVYNITKELYEDLDKELRQHIANAEVKKVSKKIVIILDLTKVQEDIHVTNNDVDINIIFVQRYYNDFLKNNKLKDKYPNLIALAKGSMASFSLDDKEFAIIEMMKEYVASLDLNNLSKKDEEILKKIINNLLKRNLDVQEVANFLGLSKKEVMLYKSDKL